MLYLDNAATGGQKPPSVQNAVRSAMQACANPGRSGHRLSLACAERVLACRTLLSDLFDGYGYERVVFTKNCTEALNLALFGLLKKGSHVVTTCLEHNSVLRPLHFLAQKEVITYEIAPLQGGVFSEHALQSAVTKNTDMVVLTSASNVTGEAPNLAKIRTWLPKNVLLVVDGAQGGGHLPIHMKEWGIDALALAGHKGLHAVQGAGALLFSDRVSPNPILLGGTGSESFNLDQPTYYPDRLESGTLSYPAICSLYEGALLAQARQKNDYEQLLRLTSMLIEKMTTLQNYTVYSKPNGCGIVSFRHNALPSEEVAQILSDQFYIAVRGGLHCAPLAHQALGTFPEGLVRASFSPFQGGKEVNDLVSALRKI